MRSYQNNRGFTLVELLIVTVIFVSIVGVTGTLLLTGLRNYSDNVERVSGQNSVRMSLLQITRDLRAAAPDEVIVGGGGSAIAIGSKTYTYSATNDTLTLTDGVNPTKTIADGLTGFTASRSGNTVTIQTRSTWSDSEVTTKVTLRSIPRPTPTP